MSAASPGVIDMFMPNRYYPSTEEYLFALADAMKTGVRRHPPGRPDPPARLPRPGRELGHGPRRTWRSSAARSPAARGARPRHPRHPAGPVRLHLCWGNYEGPHHTDIPLADIIDLVLAARPHAVSFEAANPRHEHEWKLFEDVKLPRARC